MGTGSSKKTSKISQKGNKNQQPVLTQNNTNTNRRELVTVPSPRRSFSSIRAQQTPMDDSNSIVDQNPISQRSKRSSTISNKSRSSRKTEKSHNDTQRQTSLYQQVNDNDYQAKRQSFRSNGLHTRSSSTSSVSTVRAQIAQVNLSRKNTNTQSKHPASEDERSSPILSGQTGRCSHCPHCNRLPQIPVKKGPSPQPAWIVNRPRTDQQHIIMDNYDEMAIRKKLVAEHGHIPGSYDYAPNLTIVEEKDHNQRSSRYNTLPGVTQHGSPTTPSRTPFPNYDALQRREKRLNQPYTTTLFTD